MSSLARSIIAAHEALPVPLPAVAALADTAVTELPQPCAVSGDDLARLRGDSN